MENPFRMVTRGWGSRRGMGPAMLVLAMVVVVIGGALFLISPWSPLRGEESPQRGTTLLLAEGREIVLEWESQSHRDVPKLPEGLAAVSPLYRFRDLGGDPIAARVTIALTSRVGSDDVLDAYSYQDGQWRWEASARASEGGKKAQVEFPALPPTLAIIRVSRGVYGGVAAWLPQGVDPDSAALPQLTVLNPRSYTPLPDGSIKGTHPNVPEGDYTVLPAISNVVGAGPETAAVEAILSNPDLRAKHVANIVGMAAIVGFAGVDIDYQGLNPALGSQFTAFVESLAERLHQEGMKLSVTVPFPTASDSAPGGWDTGGYDWRRIGASADWVKLRPSGDQTLYAATVSDVLAYAGTKMDRRRVQLVVDTAGHQKLGSTVRRLTLGQAFDLAAAFELGSGNAAAPGTVTLAALHLPPAPAASGLRWDEITGTVTFAFNANEGPSVVWIENAFSIMRKLEQAWASGIGGVAVDGAEAAPGSEKLWEEVGHYLAGKLSSVTPNSKQFAPVWSSSGGALSADNGAAVWTAPSAPGLYRVGLTVGDGVSRGGITATLEGVSDGLGKAPRIVLRGIQGSADLTGPAGVAALLSSPTPSPGTPPSSTPSPSATPGSGAVYRQVANTDGSGLNLRKTPSLQGVLIANYPEGTRVLDLGQSQSADGFTWLYVRAPDLAEGWAVGDYLAPVSSSTPTPTSTVGKGTPTPTPTAPRLTPTVAPTSPPPPPPASAGFGYGMQVDPSNDLNRAMGMTTGAGFSWAKVQLRWEQLEPSRGNISWGLIDSVVSTAQARGVKLLFSVVTAPDWSRPADTDWSVPGPPADPQDFANFVGAIAARHKGKVQAYEVWNEQNLWYEWGGRGNKLSATKYVELLRAAYGAIKNADPNAIVVSGAPTPTGWNDGDTAVDDLVYLRQMYEAGLKNYSDAIGQHPSGYNNPPDDDPNRNSLTPGTPAYSQYKGHWSFYFRRFEQFRQVMVEFGDASKTIWFTEFGWAACGPGSPPDCPPAEEYGYASHNSEQMQADYLRRAFEIGRTKGYVGVMFVWNLNFAHSATPQDTYAKRAFSVIRPDALWTTRPAYAALRDMPK